MARIRVRELTKDIPKEARAICNQMLKDLENAKRPSLEAVKCALDNAKYDSKVGYLTPMGKKVKTELSVSSVQKMARMVFILEILLRNIDIGSYKTKREIFYIAKGMLKSDKSLKAMGFESEPECNSIIDFICDLLEVYREEMNCFAKERGGQTYSKQLVVTESLPDGTKAVLDLGNMGTAPFQPKNRPQALKLKAKGKIDFCVVIESESTASMLAANGMTKRHNCIIMGAEGVPSNAVRSWTKTIQSQLDVPIFFFGDLDAYTLQNIYRTLKAGSASSLIRNADFSAPMVHFLGTLPGDVKKYDLHCYDVKESEPKEARALKKARDALKNDPFFQDKKNKKVADVLKWLIKEKKRCEQQAFYSVDPIDPHIFEKIIVEKIKNKDYI